MSQRACGGRVRATGQGEQPDPALPHISIGVRFCAFAQQFSQSRVIGPFLDERTQGLQPGGRRGAEGRLAVEVLVEPRVVAQQCGADLCGRWYLEPGEVLPFPHDTEELTARQVPLVVEPMDSGTACAEPGEHGRQGLFHREHHRRTRLCSFRDHVLDQRDHRADDGGALGRQCAGVADLTEAAGGEHDVVGDLARRRPGQADEPQRIGRQEVVDDPSGDPRFDHACGEDEGFLPGGVVPVLAVLLVNERVLGQAALDGEPVVEIRRVEVFEQRAMEESVHRAAEVTEDPVAYAELLQHRAGERRRAIGWELVAQVTVEFRGQLRVRQEVSRRPARPGLHPMGHAAQQLHPLAGAQAPRVLGHPFVAREPAGVPLGDERAHGLFEHRAPVPRQVPVFTAKGQHGEHQRVARELSRRRCVVDGGQQTLPQAGRLGGLFGKAKRYQRVTNASIRARSKSRSTWMRKPSRSSTACW